MPRFPRPRLAGCAIAAALLFASPAWADLLIGQTAGISGPVAASVQEMMLGAKLHLDAVNARGGVNGQKIELVSLDDHFDPKQAEANARTLIEQKGVLAMFLTRGTPHTEAVLPLLEKHQVALIAPSTGAILFHKPVRRQVFNVRAPYQAEAAKAVSQLVSMGVSRLTILHTDDSFGRDGLAGAQKGMAANHLTPTGVMSFPREKYDFAEAAQHVVDQKAQAVLIIGSGTAVVDGVSAIRKAGSRAQVVTLSNNASSGFAKQLGAHAHGVIVTQVFPNERGVNLPMIRDLTDLLRARQPGAEVSPAMVEGYAGALVLVEALRKAGNQPTRDSVLKSLDDMNRLDLGGLELKYSATDHTGLEFTDLSMIDAEGSFRR